jgi:Putative metallopeptidase
LIKLFSESVLFFFLIFTSNYCFAEINVEQSEVLVHKSLRVKAGSYSYYKFDLNRGDKLKADFKISGGFNKSLNIYLLDKNNFYQFSQNKRFNYFTGGSARAKDIFGYSFPILKNDEYYLVMDNRSALLLSRIITVDVYRFTESRTARHVGEKEVLNDMYYGFLKKLFVFDDFDISLNVCGFENASSNPNITLCRELDYANDSKNISAATTLIIFHEFGHSLMNIWGMPAYDNEDLADEFAVVLALFGNKVDAVRDGIKYFENKNSRGEAEFKLNNYDRHTVSIQRARNIIGWIKDRNNVLQRWQSQLVPHMTNEALLKLNDSSEPWVNHDVVSKELGTRDFNNEKEVVIEVQDDGKFSKNDFSGSWRLSINKKNSYLDIIFFREGYFNFAVHVGSPKRSFKSGEGSGKWHIENDKFFGEITNSNHYSYRKGYKWVDTVLSVSNREFKVFTESGAVEIFEKLDN